MSNSAFPVKGESSSAGTNQAAGQGAAQASQNLLRNIRGIVLDFDGTLFDNIRIPFYLIAAYPPDILRIRMERHIRKHFEGCDFFSPDAYYRAFFAALGKACFRSPARMRAWYFDRYMPRMIRALRKHYRLRPGVKELLERAGAPAGTPAGLPRDFPALAVYSDYPCLRERFQALDFDPPAALRLYGPECFGAQKPAARPFRQIAADFGLKPEEILVIGDREDTDGLGAYHAGMRFFCLATGRRRHFKLDPYRRAVKNEQPAGPILLMYSGSWSDISDLFREYYFKN